MLEIKFSTRAFVQDNKVFVHVYWDKKRYQTTFPTGAYAEKSKWDKDLQRPKKNTTHVINTKCSQHVCTANEINESIAKVKEQVEGAFYIYSLKNSMPTVDDIRTMVNASLGRNDEDPVKKLKGKTLHEHLEDFLKKGEREKNWDDQAKEKYTQAMTHFTSANPRIKVDGITIDSMYNLRDWYIRKEYRNRTTNKQFIMLKAILKYIDEQDGCSIPSNCLNFETNLKVIKRTVTFMHFDELMKFLTFKFVNCEERLSRVRDLWCFMAFTSLRYSDLVRLKPHHIIDGKRIEMIAEKTDGRLSIPLTEYALEIIARRGGKFGAEGFLFDVPTNQQMNDSIKDAAALAGIDREIVNTYFVGTKRHEEAKKFCEIIGCHDARRTFVSCSLAMGIPPEVVMKCTGHTGYATMKPYIDTATETQSVEMAKWNKSQYKSQIITLLDKTKEKQTKDILSIVQEIVMSGKNFSDLYVKKSDTLGKEDNTVDTDDADNPESSKKKAEDYHNMQTEVNPQPNRKRGRPKKNKEVKEDSDSNIQDDFSIMDAMKSGQLFHIEYGPNDTDTDDGGNDGDDIEDFDIVASL